MRGRQVGKDVAFQVLLGSSESGGNMLDARPREVKVNRLSKVHLERVVASEGERDPSPYCGHNENDQDDRGQRAMYVRSKWCHGQYDQECNDGHSSID